MPNINHHTFFVTYDEYIKEFENLVLYKGSPLGVPNEVLLAILSKKLQKDITVILSGEGADENFAGYGRIFRSAFYHNKTNSPNHFYGFFINNYDYIKLADRDKYFSLDTSLRNNYNELLRNEFNQYNNNENIYRFFFNYHLKGLLMRLDYTTMYSFIEGRVPFLDHNFVEYVAQIGNNMKIKFNKNMPDDFINKSPDLYSEIYDTPKYILKQLAYKYIPATIIERKKMGFPLPLDKWSTDIWNQYKDSILELDIIKNKDELTLQLNNINNKGYLIWMLASLSHFKKVFFKKSWTY